jgi:TRAP-type transport system periplasmic protein
LGARSVSFFDAEVIIASSYSGHMLKFTQEFAYFTEIFFAAHLTFLAARQDVFDSLSETERRILLGAGHDTELALWKLMRELLPRRQQEIAARGVRVVAQPPVDVLAALREAAEPDIQAWARSVGSDGGTILADYRRA